ncbi:hypothetical protein Q1695_015282 [Nippostrongylus brasiliensis]|nr:hypothetical protein Q1695_015282 [Nippostrongylus brasiliensis]
MGGRDGHEYVIERRRESCVKKTDGHLLVIPYGALKEQPDPCRPRSRLLQAPQVALAKRYEFWRNFQ